MREKYYLNRKWKYTDEFEGALLIERMKGGEEIDIPHTFKVTPFNYVDADEIRVQSVYQRTFFVKKEWKGKKLVLTFDGVAERASVYVNGVNLSIHECGSTPFSMDISLKVEYDKENLITVLVDSRNTINQPPFVSDKPVDVIPFGGIYRDVYLEIKEIISIESVQYIPETALPPDTRGMSKEKLLSYSVPGRLKSIIELSDMAKRLAGEGRISVRQTLNDLEIAYQPLAVDGETVTSTGNVQLWDIDSPVCYRIQTDLLFDDEIIDTDVSLIGFRTAVFDQSGFYLNGRKVKIRGIARHQVFPYVGYAMPESMQRFDARILKEELRVNAVRTIGSVPSPYFVDECDKRGILVFCETPGYRYIGDEAFMGKHLKNVEEMVRTYRNHPSIFLWGTRVSGSPSTSVDSHATALAHALDGTRPTAGERMESDMECAEDVYSYTDLSASGKGDPLLSKEEATSDMSKPYLVSGYLGESYPVKLTDSPKRKVGQITLAASILDAQAFLDDICGSFALSMCDHLSLSETSAEDGIVYHGFMDAFRNKKPICALYSIQNNPSPELSVYPPLTGDRERWEGFSDVYILTNTESVKVYRDDEFICEYTAADTPFGHMRHGPILMNDFLGDILEKDEIKTDQSKRIKKMLNQMAIGGISTFIQPGQVMDRIISRIMFKTNRKQLMDLYEYYVSKSHEYRFEGIKDGQVAVTKTLKPSSGRFLRVDSSSKNLIERHSYDVISIRIMVSNESGEVLSNFAEPVIINTRGPIKLVGPGIVPLRGGMAGAYIRSLGQEGDAEVIVSCGNLADKKMTFNVFIAPENLI